MRKKIYCKSVKLKVIILIKNEMLGLLGKDKFGPEVIKNLLKKFIII